MIYKSVQTNQTGILLSILRIHAPGDLTFSCDPFFNSGSMYGHVIPYPEHCFDINPIHPRAFKGNALNLHLASKSIKSIILDPPFLISKSQFTMADKYSAYDSKTEMIETFKGMIDEAYRVLKENGLLVVKVQDCVNNRRRFFSSLFIKNYAIFKGFNIIDEIILYTQNRINTKTQTGKYGTRSHHSSFIVFRKKKSRSQYMISKK